MAVLVNFVRMSGWQFKSIEKARFQEPLFLSIIMFVSYLMGSVVDYFAHIKNYRAYFYPNGFYLLLDLLTILFIFHVVNVKTKQGEQYRKEKKINKRRRWIQKGI
jgi:putative flippase GtrA